MKSAISKARVLLATLLLVCWGSAAADFGLGFSPTATFIPQNGTVTVDIVITGLATERLIVSTYDFTITLDPALLQFVSIIPTGALGAGSSFESSMDAGEIGAFGLSLLEDAELATLQIVDFLALATLTFIATAPGTSSLAFGSILALGGAQFLDPNSGFVTTDLLALPHTVGSATVNIELAVVPEPAPLFLLLLALALLARHFNRTTR